MTDCAIVPALIWIAFLLGVLALFYALRYSNLKIRDWWIQNVRKEFRYAAYVLAFVGWVIMRAYVDAAICP